MRSITEVVQSLASASSSERKADCSKIDSPNGESVSVVYANQLDNGEVASVELVSFCEDNQLKTYAYTADDLAWAE